MKDSLRRIRRWQPEAIIVICLLLSVPCLLCSQTAEFAPSQAQNKANFSKMQSAEPPRLMTPAQQTKIPPLVGHTILDVRRIVAGKFTVAFPDQRALTTPQEVVVRQYPEAGTPAKAGAEIEIWLSEPKGTPPPPPPSKLAPVPNLVGHTRDSAIEILRLTNFAQGEITTRESEESDDIVLSQDPTAAATVPPKTPVSFTVSRQIRRTLTLSGPSIGKPGDPLTFVAHLDPAFPSTQYQFTFGDGPTGKLDSNPEREHAFPADGNYEVRAFALWDGGKAASEPLIVTVHSVTYVLTVMPSPIQQKEHQTVNFHAELDPSVENVKYTFDFGDGTLQQSESPDFGHIFSRAGAYNVRVSVTLLDHGHKIVSAPSRVMIIAEPTSPVDGGHWLNESKPWIVGGLVLLSAGFVLGRLGRGTRKPPPSKIELRPAIPPGKVIIRAQGRLWSRIEGLRDRNR